VSLEGLLGGDGTFGGSTDETLPENPAEWLASLGAPKPAPEAEASDEEE
jgi:hypothetical protein